MISNEDLKEAYNIGYEEGLAAGQENSHAEPDTTAIASWVYKFTSPPGVVRWEQLPQHRRDGFEEAIEEAMRKSLAVAYGENNDTTKEVDK